MTQTTYKRIPFDIELAKKIINKEKKGRIVTRNGNKARIICTDVKDMGDVISVYNIIALIESKDGTENPFSFTNKGLFLDSRESDKDLYIEVPTYYQDYSNFKPCKWQPCLVRDISTDLWEIAVCRGTDSNRIPIFYSVNNSGGYCYWKYLLPLSKVTECLFGTKKSYKELIQELDKE